MARERHRVHYRARGSITPRGMCGAAWLARVTRVRARVTCRRCLDQMAKAAAILDVERRWKR